MADRLEMFAANSGRWGDTETECLEPTLIKLTYSYEQATKHRAPPGL
ncbi:MAG: hypothetical protein U5K32_09940 [Bacteroidales bacterium]|nr:hypothetical protein [Bacteroidales bacterium]